MNLPYPLILASTSKYRKELLSQLGWPFEAVAPGVDEDALKKEDLSCDQLALELSRLKAKAVYLKYEGSCVIGSDQVCHLDGSILSKPGSRDKAIEQLLFMQGKTHELLTAVTIITPEDETSFINRTLLHMRDLTQSDVEAYVDHDHPFDCAGSYKLESRGIKLFERIEMSDHSAIIGLPLIELTNVLVKYGYPL